MSEQTDQAGIDQDQKETSPAPLVLDFGLLNSMNMLTPDAPRTQLSEEFRHIKRPLLNNAFGTGAALVDKSNLIMVTSTLAGEGKTFVSINLAMCMAMELDKHVLLVDADLLNPSVFRYLKLPDSTLGVGDYIRRDDVTVSDILRRTNVPNLSLLAAGVQRSASVELLSSEKMASFIDELAERYPDRVIIFDAPPLLVSNEARTLADRVGQIIVVVEAERTLQSELTESLENLSRDKSINLVLNKSRRQQHSHGYYGYHQYGQKPSE